MAGYYLAAEDAPTTIDALVLAVWLTALFVVYRAMS